MKTPCYQCQTRCLNCHANCDAYIDYAMQREEMCRQKIMQGDADGYKAKRRRHFFEEIIEKFRKA